MNHATPAGTARYFARLAHGSLQPNDFGATGLRVSPIGFGGYRINDFEPEHRDALAHALSTGVNLIDTSANYSDGGSERLVGDVLRDLIASDVIARDEVLVVTKAGYVQGANLAEARRRLAQRSPFSEMVEYRPDCWHCVSPDFLADQLSRSLERMRLECIDVFLLHNPEYFLRSGGDRDEYDRRLKRAFVHMEREADAGRIQWYGVSSNGFPEPEARSEFTSLERILELAHEAAVELGKKKSRFAAAQFPLNAYEAGGGIIANNSGKTTLEIAKANKIAALANRPLNAFHRGRLARLSSFKRHDEIEIKGELHRVLGRAIELERKAPIEKPSVNGLGWAQALRDKLSDIDDVLLWRDAVQQQIFPSLAKGLERARERDGAWTDEYRGLIVELTSLVEKDLESVAAKRADVISGQFAALAPGLASATTLSQMAISVAKSFSGITSVLVGMRTRAYVDDASAAPAAIPHAQVAALAQALNRKS